MNRKVSFALAAIVLSGCAPPQSRDGTPVFYGGYLGWLEERQNPGSTYKRMVAYDDARCRDYGFQKGTAAYADCRLRLEQMRSNERAGGAPVPPPLLPAQHR